VVGMELRGGAGQTTPRTSSSSGCGATLIHPAACWSNSRLIGAGQVVPPVILAVGSEDGRAEEVEHGEVEAGLGKVDRRRMLGRHLLGALVGHLPLVVDASRPRLAEVG